MAWSGMVWHGMGHGSMGNYLVLVAVGVPTPEEEISQSHERGRALTGRQCYLMQMAMATAMANDDGEMHTILSPTCIASISGAAVDAASAQLTACRLDSTGIGRPLLFRVDTPAGATLPSKGPE